MAINKTQTNSQDSERKSPDHTTLSDETLDRIFQSILGHLSVSEEHMANLKERGITFSQAEEYREKWMEAFPEMRLYLQDERLSQHDFSSLEWCDSPEIAVAIFKRIVAGNTFKTDGRPYSDSTLRWAFETALPDIAPEFTGTTRGSPELMEAIFDQPVVTRTGRIRAKPAYGSRNNTPFQGLAADGAKIALYRLIRAGYRVVNFVHDENVIEVPADGSEEAERMRIVDIMERGMGSVVPDVKIRVSSAVVPWWKKPD